MNAGTSSQGRCGTPKKKTDKKVIKRGGPEATYDKLRVSRTLARFTKILCGKSASRNDRKRTGQRRAI